MKKICLLVEATVLHPSSENTDGSKLAEVSKTDEASEDLLPLADDLRDDFPLAEVNELSVLVLAVEEDWLASFLSWYLLL